MKTTTTTNKKKREITKMDIKVYVYARNKSVES